MNRLKIEREKKEMSQFELAIESKINQSNISQIENGKIFPYPGWRERLAEALEVAERDLFPEIQEDEKKQKR